MPDVLFRADGSATTGLGHLYRCCALSEILGRSFTKTLITKSPGFDGFDLIAGYFDNVVSMPIDATLDEELAVFTSFPKVHIIVLDGYQFQTAYQHAVKQTHSCPLVSIDDIYNCHFLSDVVINHAGGITQDQYSAETYTRFFLGVAYSIIRPVFSRTGATYGIPADDKRSVLITYGAADPGNRTQHTLQSLLETPGEAYRIHAVIGGANKYKDSLIQQFGHNRNVTLHYNIDASAMLYLMHQCNICIASPSTVSLEYLNATNGLLISDVIADNQKDFYHYLTTHHFTVPLSAFLEQGMVALDAIDLSLVQRTFDGQSATRLRKIFTDLI